MPETPDWWIERRPEDMYPPDESAEEDMDFEFENADDESASMSS